MAVIQDGKYTRIISLTEMGVEIVAHNFCRRVLVQENYDSATGATTDLAMEAPVGADAVIVLKGVPAIFTAAGGPNGQYTPGTIVGKVYTAAGGGTVEGQQIESQLI
jgi:hypothetical protein